MQNKLKNFLIENGAGQVGFFKLPDDTNFGLEYGISFTIPLSQQIVDGIDNAPTHTYFHHYRTVNTLIDNLALRTGLMLGREGWRYVPVAASQSVNGLQGIFSHKMGAYLAGIGYVGRSGLFISTQNGPRIRLGTILTDYPFEVSGKTVPFGCGECTLCAASCPAMAIRGEDWAPNEPREKIIDAHACSDYMKKQFQHIGRGVVCGICMKVCPK